MMFQKNLQNFLLAAKMQKDLDPMLDSRPYFTGGFDLAKGRRAMGRRTSSPPDSVGGMVLGMGESVPVPRSF